MWEYKSMKCMVSNIDIYDSGSSFGMSVKHLRAGIFEDFWQYSTNCYKFTFEYRNCAFLSYVYYDKTLNILMIVS